ncbi:hypothetical protein Sden_0064 [Shewanella denitrificans OS217]|jgi:hypothetical protein|uniref:Uncharacterized protein n=1 Tax=Shewanella denitrificans (strain OS217 / ATCC BAA-1090 / DSM 15013) TaxID=318161 RepID=Q12T65_SHEDO|nr:hypothetical protein [Shewanella denitrificans]ABE53361.1 hypothetical protein Sden_0064 [Shewanella denitrificans OS217]
MNTELISLMDEISSLPPAQVLEKLKNASSTVKLDPDWLFLVACYQVDNQELSEAKKSFFSLLDSNPDNEVARLQLACVHLSLGEFKHILYLLCPYLVWQIAPTCISSIAHALINFVQNDKKKMNSYLNEAKAFEEASELKSIIDVLSRFFVDAAASMGTVADNEEELKHDTRSHLLSNLYSKKY